MTDKIETPQEKIHERIQNAPTIDALRVLAREVNRQSASEKKEAAITKIVERSEEFQKEREKLKEQMKDEIDEKLNTLDERLAVFRLLAKEDQTAKPQTSVTTMANTFGQRALDSIGSLLTKSQEKMGVFGTYALSLFTSLRKWWNDDGLTKITNTALASDTVRTFLRNIPFFGKNLEQYWSDGAHVSLLNGELEKSLRDTGLQLATVPTTRNWLRMRATIQPSVTVPPVNIAAGVAPPTTITASPAPSTTMSITQISMEDAATVSMQLIDKYRQAFPDATEEVIVTWDDLLQPDTCIERLKKAKEKSEETKKE